MPLCPSPFVLSSGSRAPCPRKCSNHNLRLGSGRRKPVTVICSAAVASARTHYDVLGVRDNASVRDIKDAFRRLALMWHPDRCKQPGAKDKFMELKAAYDTLVDMTARASYDLKLKQATSPPPSAPSSGPTTVGYDWSKYRTASVRRAGSVRKPGAAAQTQTAGYGSNPAVPPKPPARASSGDDYEMFTRVGSSADGRSTSTRSASAYASASPRAGSTAGVGSSNGYRSIFDGPATASAPAGGAAAGRSSSTTRSASVGGAAGIFNRTTTASYQQPAGAGQRSTSAFSRSSSRSGSRARNGRSPTPTRSGSSSAWSSRASSPTPAQQWHSMYCHSGDDFVSSSGTSYAATTALVRSSAYAAATGAGAPSSWHNGVSGDGFKVTALATTTDSPGTSLSVKPNSDHHLTSSWRSAAAMAAGDDYHVQHALVPVEQKSSLPVKVTPQWNQVASFISVGMN